MRELSSSCVPWSQATWSGHPSTGLSSTWWPLAAASGSPGALGLERWAPRRLIGAVSLLTVMDLPQTVLLRHLMRLAGESGAYRTALTGIAALAIKGVTLHKFSGCGLAKEDVASLARRLSFPARDRWKKARVLFIDEVSMMDAALFEKFDALGRRVRGNSSALWGGIQLVMVGDFFQLPPVAKAGRDGDVEGARMLFESPAFLSPDVAKVKLTRVFRWGSSSAAERGVTDARGRWFESIRPPFCACRQKDPRLLDLLEAARYGRLEDKHRALLSELERPLPTSAEGVQATKLYPVNVEVDSENEARLLSGECEGELQVYEPEDFGKGADLQYLVKNCLAAAPLRLRLNAQVVHLANAEDRRLVNGSRGVVIAFEPASNDPVVRLTDGSSHTIRRHTWEYKPDPKGRVLASRSQIPLKLAWALSIHKSQASGRPQ